MGIDAENSRPTVLVLDAMGVIYKAGDDVAELLIPFIQEHGGITDTDEIESVYKDASLGRMRAREFWRRVNVSHALEDKYLSRFQLSDGFYDFLKSAEDRFTRIVCLSNDLSEWSRKLRQRFDLVPHFAGWYISSDLGCRKPDRPIYRHMLADLQVEPSQVLFIDDRVRNLDAAAAVGIQTVYYDVGQTSDGGGHWSISRLAEIHICRCNDNHSK